MLVNLKYLIKNYEFPAQRDASSGRAAGRE